TYRPSSQSVKPDVLSRQFTTSEDQARKSPILPPTCRAEPDPGTGPPGLLFVPTSVRSRVLQWAHRGQTHLSSGHSLHHHLHLVVRLVAYTAAQSYCRTYHTDLTSIRSKEEKSNITLTLNGSGFVWIGLYRDPWAPWSDNTTSTFTNWLSGQPNNYFPPEDCVAFNLNTGKWCDSNCSTRVRFFCFTGEVQNANTV
uniref:C-type lectin domain-containing protein n=1 Tax=Pundamilia nyererei TaxID=303518 RepID=A0A3B4GF95_9CICH